MKPNYYSGMFVVIVNWRRPHETIDCIQSILHGGLPAERVLVVDNGSDDNSIMQISNAYPDVQIYGLPENLGFTGGYNHGIKLALSASADKVLILNNDTVINEHTIPTLMETDWDVAVPKIYYHGDSNRIWSAGAYWRRFPPMVAIRGYGELDNSPYDQPVPLEYATACALLVRRQVFEQVGMFDPRFENYYEDYDFCYRVRTAGFQIGYVPEALVWHKVSLTLGLTSSRFWWYLGRNSVLFYRTDNRFPFWMMSVFLLWITLRETIKLNHRRLFDFWDGVGAGWKLVMYGNSEM
jgi:GT2 family glycosyltransferase